MRKTLALSLIGLFAAACTTDAPEPYIAVPAPDWVANIRIDKVSKHSCRVTGPAGHTYNVARSGTLIGGDLIASRSTDDCSIRDNTGVLCTWDRAEKPQGCRRANPAYKAP